MSGIISSSNEAAKGFSEATSGATKNMAAQAINGYKKETVSFIPLVTGGGNGAFSPGGVKTQVTREVTKAGVIQNTGVTTHLAVSGDNGFLPVSSSNNEEGGGAIALTRDGAFRQNAEGFIERDGFFLMGYPTSPNGKVNPGINTDLVADLRPIRVNDVAGVVTPTSEIEFSGNLSSGDNFPIGQTFTKTQRIFDSLGKSHNLNFVFERIANGTDDDNKVQFSVKMDIDGGVVKRTDTAGAEISDGGAPMVISFNTNGHLNLFDYGQAGTEGDLPPGLHIEWTDPDITSGPLDITWDLGQGKGLTPGGGWAGAANPNAAGALTAFQGATAISYASQNGVEYGRCESISFDDSGVVTAMFSNGQAVPVARIPLLSTPNPNGMSYASGNVFYETRDSGTTFVGEAGKNGLGSLKSGALEESTVDMSEEFSKIIKFKSGYSGVMSMIKTGKEMEEEIISIMR